MAQQTTGDFDIDPASDSGTELAGFLNRNNAAELSMHSGATEPTYKVTHMLWMDTASGTTHICKRYNSSSTWVELFRVIVSTGAVVFTGATAPTSGGHLVNKTYADALPNSTITLSGDVSGSGTSSISVTVNDDSHNHIISNVDGLQTALNLKANIASPTLTGNPQSVTPGTTDNDTSIATTNFVRTAITNYALTSPTISNPNLTGNPKSVTPATSDNDTSIATTNFVRNAIATYSGSIPDYNAVGAIGFFRLFPAATQAPGSSISGSGLLWGSTSSSGIHSLLTPSGTWRVLGNTINTEILFTVCQRIA